LLGELMAKYSEPKMEPIPWDYSKAESAGSFNIWEWNTGHFNAKMLEDGSRYVYSVIDKTRSHERELISSTSAKFEEAENAVRETVAKSYPAAAGYLKYGGVLSTSFYIADGTFRNFGPLVGQTVSIVATEDGDRKRYVGQLNIVGKRIILRPSSGPALRIPPNLVVEIRAINGEPIKLEFVNLNFRRSRTVRGRKDPGCTGAAGFLAGTVEHPSHSPWCPIHQV